MKVIVISRVLKYRALIIGIALLLTLAFFQSNQSLDESSTESSSDGSASSQSGAPETPSIPKIPDLPESPDLADSDDLRTKISISIRTSTNTNGSDEDSSGGETTVQEIEKELTNGSISLIFTSNGGEQSIKEKIEDEAGKTTVKFKTKVDVNTEDERSQKTVVEEERSTD